MVTKQLVHQMLIDQDHPLADTTADRMHIESQNAATNRGERPVMFVDACHLGFAISISHSPRGVLVAVSPSDALTLGVDLVPIDHSTDKLSWTFTDAERHWLASAGYKQGQAEQLWAMKEAMYKACQRSEGFSPRSIEVVPGQMPRYLQSDVARDLTALQCWQVDGHRAALAVIRNRPASRSIGDASIQVAKAG